MVKQHNERTVRGLRAYIRQTRRRIKRAEANLALPSPPSCLTCKYAKASSDPFPPIGGRELSIGDKPAIAGCFAGYESREDDTPAALLVAARLTQVLYCKRIIPPLIDVHRTEAVLSTTRADAIMRDHLQFKLKMMLGYTVEPPDGPDGNTDSTRYARWTSIVSRKQREVAYWRAWLDQAKVSLKVLEKQEKPAAKKAAKKAGKVPA